MVVERVPLDINDLVAAPKADVVGSDHGLDNATRRFSIGSRAQADARLDAGTARRAELRHYSAAMFYCDREWYWGADRFYHLEDRLVEAGAAKTQIGELICPRPAIKSGPLQDNDSLTLEFYPSLRSPYTSIIFDTTVRLAEDTGVILKVRPVLPMVMRGVPATREKGSYIIRDTAREARTIGVEWGKIYDPIGQPVRNCYSLYAWARQYGREIRLLSCFLRAAFVDGANTNTRKGMRKVVEDAGLPWNEAAQIMGNRDWEEEFEANRLAVYDFGCWGVPSYRLLDTSSTPVLAVKVAERLAITFSVS